MVSAAASCSPWRRPPPRSATTLAARSTRQRNPARVARRSARHSPIAAEEIPARAADEYVVALGALNPVIAVAAEQDVITRVAIEVVAAAFAANNIVASQAADAIGTLAAEEEVVRGTACDQIVASLAMNLHAHAGICGVDVIAAIAAKDAHVSAAWSDRIRPMDHAANQTQT